MDEQTVERKRNTRVCESTIGEIEIHFLLKRGLQTCFAMDED
jgi:hypothetical protein